MKIDKNTYILGCWFASSIDRKNSWHMIICKKDGEWKGEYTFRYKKNDDPFSGKDKKSIYKVFVDGNEPEENIIKNNNNFFEYMKTQFDGFNDWFLVKGNYEKFIEIAEKKHYMNFKKLKSKKKLIG